MRILLFLLLTLLFLSGCNRRNLAYLENLVGPDGTYNGTYTPPGEQRIRVGDLLSISVSSASQETDRLFNRGVEGPEQSIQGYLVDAEGTIEFPVIGKVEVLGLTKAELRDRLRERLSEYLQNPAVIIRFRNVTVTVLGEVENPSTFTVPNESITLLQALGMAGDMTVYGKREEVLVIREVNGVRTAARLNLQDPATLNSPYYFLQSNDVVYVEPVDAKAEQASLSRSNISIAVSVLSIITFLIVGR
jgi:polysaccharide export outer membrane protein